MYKRNNWKPVKLEGAFLNKGIEDLIGIEELSTYDIEENNFHVDNKSQPTISSKKRKENDDIIESSKIKLKTKKRKTNCDDNVKNVGKYVRSPIVIKKNTKIKVKKEVGTSDILVNKIASDDLINWANLSLPNELLQAIGDQGFTTPTSIQALTLPPAILGRRDILGAAETGSGKTLAFGLPILCGILNLKSNNIDINQIEHKKVPSTSSKISPSVKSASNNRNDDLEKETNYFSDSSDELEWEDDEFEKNDDEKTNSVNKPLYALILTPTRELAVQIKNHLIAAAKYTDIKIAVVLGGMAAVKQERILSRCPEIVVATPGRLWELIQEGNPHLSKVDNIRYLAIDETDRMIERGHFEELHRLLERLNTNEDRKKLRQNFIFSATLTLVHDLPKHLLRKKRAQGRRVLKITPGQKLQKFIEMFGVSNPKVVDVTKEKGVAEGLTECRITCSIEDKDYYLYYFLKRHPGRTLIFCNSIGCVKRLTTLFTLLQCAPLPLHASMQQRQRLKNLERFRDDVHGVLIATDVAARGLDIPQVEHVLHYQVPRTAENYVHRSGRTARATTEGITVLFMEPTELKNYVRLCHTLGRTEDLPLFPVADNILSVIKQRVNLARDLDKLELHARKSNSETGWLQKAVEEMDILLDNDDINMSNMLNDETTAQQKRAANVKRKQLAAILAKPLFPKGFASKYPTSTGQINIPLVQGEQPTQNAIAVMKSAMENYAKSRPGLNFLGQRLKSKTENIEKKRAAKQKKKDKKKKLKRDAKRSQELQSQSQSDQFE